MALHKALADQPRYPSVVAAFSLAVHNGGDVLEAVKITQKVTKPHNRSFFELLEPEELDSQTLLDEVMDLDSSIKEALGQMTDGKFISKAMAAYPQAPYSDMVSIPTFLSFCNEVSLIHMQMQIVSVEHLGYRIWSSLIHMQMQIRLRRTPRL